MINTDSHCAEVGNGTIGNADFGKGFEEGVEVFVEFCKLIDGINITYIAPSIGKGLFLCGGIFEVNAFKEYVVIALGVKGRINVNEINEATWVLLV